MTCPLRNTTHRDFSDSAFLSIGCTEVTVLLRCIPRLFKVHWRPPQW